MAQYHAKWRPGQLFAFRIASLGEGALRFCPIPGCGRLPSARVGDGLSLTHCRHHVQLKNRFGSYWKRNIPAAVLKPYRRAAERFVKANAGEFYVAAALRSLEALMDGAGHVERIVDVNELLSPRDKARAALARLRSAEIAPERLLIAYLAVAAVVEVDPIRPGGEPGEYLRVQAAKRIFRMKSGQHIVYAPGITYDRYPRSGGLALRHLGGMLQEACEFVHHYHLAAVLRHAAETSSMRANAD